MWGCLWAAIRHVLFSIWLLLLNKLVSFYKPLPPGLPCCPRTALRPPGHPPLSAQERQVPARPGTSRRLPPSGPLRGACALREPGSQPGRCAPLLPAGLGAAPAAAAGRLLPPDGGRAREQPLRTAPGWPGADGLRPGPWGAGDTKRNEVPKCPGGGVLAEEEGSGAMYGAAPQPQGRRGGKSRAELLPDAPLTAHGPRTGLRLGCLGRRRVQAGPSHQEPHRLLRHCFFW